MTKPFKCHLARHRWQTLKTTAWHPETAVYKRRLLLKTSGKNTNPNSPQKHLRAAANAQRPTVTGADGTTKDFGKQFLQSGSAEHSSPLRANRQAIDLGGCCDFRKSLPQSVASTCQPFVYLSPLGGCRPKTDKIPQFRPPGKPQTEFLRSFFRDEHTIGI